MAAHQNKSAQKFGIKSILIGENITEKNLFKSIAKNTLTYNVFDAIINL